MYERILIPTDGSDGAGRGVDHGLNIADKYDATVHVLYVVDSRIYGDSDSVRSEAVDLEAVKKIGRKAIDAVTAQAEELGLATKTAQVRGVPADAIVAYAADHAIDLVVMGIHGQSAVKRPNIGSVTDRVIRTTTIPVLPV